MDDKAGIKNDRGGGAGRRERGDTKERYYLFLSSEVLVKLSVDVSSLSSSKDAREIHTAKSMIPKRRKQ
jgi:hypothetical protein